MRRLQAVQARIIDGTNMKESFAIYEMRKQNNWRGGKPSRPYLGSNQSMCKVEEKWLRGGNMVKPIIALPSEIHLTLLCPLTSRQPNRLGGVSALHTTHTFYVCTMYMCLYCTVHVQYIAVWSNERRYTLQKYLSLWKLEIHYLPSYENQVFESFRFFFKIKFARFHLNRFEENSQHLATVYVY